MKRSSSKLLFAGLCRLEARPFIHAAAVVLTLAGAVFLLYLPTLSYPFVFDDGHNIVNNPHVRIKEISVASLIDAGFKSPSANRPLANISFALNYYFQGYHAAGFRLINILIHIVSGILLYFLIRTTLNISSPGPSEALRRWTPFFAAFIWLAHPLQTQTVTYVVQRMNALAAMFYILCVLLYVRARLTQHPGKKWILYAGCFFGGTLALASKENAAMLPVFIFLYEWFFFQDLSRAWLKKHLLHIGLVVGFMVLVIFIFLGGQPFERLISGYGPRDFTPAQRMLTEFRVIVFYVSLLLFPHPSRLNLDHDFALSFSLLTPVTTLLSIAAIAAMAALAVYWAPKERFLSFSIIWFLGNLVIESSFIPLEIVFEHRTYLPLMFGIPACIILAGRWLKPGWLKIPALIAALSVCVVWTYDRNTVWRDEVALWQDSARKSPGKARPHYNLGLALEAAGSPDEAIQSYLQAVRIEPDYAEAYNNLGVAYADKKMLPEAIRYYDTALRINSAFDRAHHNLGLALARQGKLNAAVPHFYEAVRINPYYANARLNLGIALAKTGRLAEAESQLAKAVQIKPGFAEAYYSLGLVQARQGNPEQAVKSFSEALRIKPDFGAAQRSLQATLRQMKNSSRLQ